MKRATARKSREEMKQSVPKVPRIGHKVNKSTERDAPARDDRTSKSEERDLKVIAQSVAGFWTRQYRRITGIQVVPDPVTLRCAAADVEN